MKLLAPAQQSGTISVGGQELEVVNGVVTVDDAGHLAVLLNSHGFKEYVEKGAQALNDDDDGSDINDETNPDEIMLGMVPRFTRAAMQSTLRQLGVHYLGNASNDKLRAMVSTEIQARVDRRKAGHEVKELDTDEARTAAALADKQNQDNANKQGGDGSSDQSQLSDEEKQKIADANAKAAEDAGKQSPDNQSGGAGGAAGSNLPPQV